MKIVKFKDGTYGIRKWSWFWLRWCFLDLNTPRYWWCFRQVVEGERDLAERNCKGTAAQCADMLSKIKQKHIIDNGTILKT